MVPRAPTRGAPTDDSDDQRKRNFFSKQINSKRSEQKIMKNQKIRYNSEIHHRRSIRLKEYNYSSPGYYFVTVCTQYRYCLFGRVINGQMQLNDAGKMVDYQWTILSNRFHNIQIDEYVVMPNHFHAFCK